MFQSVLTNRVITIEELCKRLNKSLIVLGDKLESNQKFGTQNNVDIFKFIQLKRLKPLVDTFDSDIGKCCLVIKNKQQLINKIYKVTN